MTVAGLQVLSVNTSKQSEHLFKHAEKVTQHGNNTDLLDVGFFFKILNLLFGIIPLKINTDVVHDIHTQSY